MSTVEQSVRTFPFSSPAASPASAPARSSHAIWKSFAVLHALLPVGGSQGRRVHHRGRRWKSLPGFQRRHRCSLKRSLPSGGGARNSRAGRAAHPHVGHRLLLRRADGARGEAQRDRTGRRGATRIVRAIRARRPWRARSSWRAGPPRRDKIIAIPRSFHGRTMGALSLTRPQGGAARGLRSDGARGHARAVSQLLTAALRAEARVVRGGVRAGTSRKRC